MKGDIVDIRRFVVVGKHSLPSDFENYALVQLLKRDLLTLQATDDDSSEPKEFVFRIRETHHDPNFWINVVLLDTGKWIRIDAVDEKVFFDLYPG